MPPTLCRMLGQNQLSGSLPGQWAGNNAFQSLTELDVSANQLEGDLPDSYGAQGSFSGLQLLRLGTNKFTGEAGVILRAGCCWFAGSLLRFPRGAKVSMAPL